MNIESDSLTVGASLDLPPEVTEAALRTVLRNARDWPDWVDIVGGLLGTRPGNTAPPTPAETQPAAANRTPPRPVWQVGEWVTRGACCGAPDPDLWHPIREKEDADTRLARRICGGCEVRDDCLDHALRKWESGIWGGTTEAERKSIRKARRRQEAT